MQTAAVAFERRATRPARVFLRVSEDERRELVRLARNAKATVSDILRDGLAHVRRQHMQPVPAKRPKPNKGG